MTSNKKIIKNALLAAAILIGIASCKKLDQPALPGDYPQDTPVTPPTSLRFYLPFDSTTEAAKQLNIRFADSISNYPSFFPDAAATVVAGISGTAYQGTSGTYLHYYNANDFASSKSFTLSFWMKIALAQKDNDNAAGVLTLADTTTTKFWGQLSIYADHTTGGPSDSMDLKFHFYNSSFGDNWDFANYTQTARWPKMYDGNWHNVIFTYDAAAKIATLYRDAVQFDKKTNEDIAFFPNSASQFIVGGMPQMLNIAGKQSDNTWQKGFPGAFDQIRLYNVALSASDVTALYNSKQ